MIKADRIGLVVVLASLSAIATIAYLVCAAQHEQRLEAIRSQGISLVRVLSGVPFDQLIPGGKQQGVVQMLQHGARSDDFAYVSIVDLNSHTVNELTAKGLIVPTAEIPSEPSVWLGETAFQRHPGTQRIIEFHAPLFEAGELKGFVRLGYRHPKSGLDVSQVPFLAAVALPVFLLVPLFYLLLRSEVRPVRKANQEISRLLEGESFRRMEVTASGELGEFMQHFNRFAENSSLRIGTLEEDQSRLITSTKLLTYRKNRIESVLETIPESILILDESGTITFANQKLATMFNVSQEVVLSQPPHKWCDNPDILNLLSKHQSNGKGHNFTDTIRFNLDSIANQAIVTKAYPLFTPKQPSSATGTLIIFRDESQEALARQARADFVAHLSHELKSPLNVLAMYSESLLSEAGKTEKFRIEAANVIADEVSRLNTLISGMLNMTQIENGSLTPDRSLAKLRDIAEAAFEEARHLALGRDYNFEFDAPMEMSPVLVDKDLIRIAINNLLSNAVKYNKNRGLVRLTIEETEDAVQLRVTDSGIGVSETEAARVFDKFYRSEDQRVQSIGGHGLGLALSKQIIELHHGSLSLNHERDEGAEFIINLWKETSAVKQAI